MTKTIDHCDQLVWHSGMVANCSRTGKLEFRGGMYCKQHHPPSQAEKKAKTPKCQYHYEGGGWCGKGLTGDNASEKMRYCLMHRGVVQLDLLHAKARAFDKIKKLFAAAGGSGGYASISSMKFRSIMKIRIRNPV